MNQKEQFDEVDNLIFEHFSKNNDVPESTKKVVYNVFNNRKKYIINNFRKVAVYIISIAVITSSVVLADGFINTQNNIFVNTTDAIDAAIENGYIQSVDMDFIYDNNIGIRANNIVLDDKTADISFEYKCEDDIEYSGIMIDKYDVKTNNLKNSNEEIYENIHIKGFRQYKRSRKVGANTFIESVIYNLDDKYNNFNKIYFEIKSVMVKKDEVYKTIHGNWNFEIELNNQMLNRKSEIYKVTENGSVESISAKLMELTFSVDIVLNETVDASFVNGKNGLILKDKTGKEYRYRTVSVGNEIDEGETRGKIYVEYDISKFQENLEELELYIKANKDKEIKLELKK